MLGRSTWVIAMQALPREFEAEPDHGGVALDLNLNRLHSGGCRSAGLG